MNILIVDDCELNRKVLRAALESAGHTAREAADGIEALALLPRDPVDLLISDILMPNMDGYRLCYEIRKRPEFRILPILIYTATFTSPSDEQFALDSGADRYLRKPASTSELLEAVTELHGKGTTSSSVLRAELGDLEMARQYNDLLIKKLEAKNFVLTDQTELLQRAQNQLRLMASRLESVREEEATRISRELHDELGQALTALNIDLNWIQDRTQEVADGILRRKMLDRLGSMLATVQSTVRSVQKISSDLRPGMLDHFGLLATLEWLIEDFVTHAEVPCEWKMKPESLSLDRLESTTLFRIAREALTNIARHAHATRVTLSLKQDASGTFLEITDDGQGFTQEEKADSASLGLIGMRERAAMVGGRFEIETAPGRGTMITFSLPSFKKCAY